MNVNVPINLSLLIFTNIKMSADQLQCTMEGYITMVNEILNLLFVVLTVNYSTIRLIVNLVPNFGPAFELLYSFLMGSLDWVGYAIAGLYYIGLDLGYGDLMC